MTVPRIPAPSPEYVGPSPHVMHDGAGHPLNNNPIRQVVVHCTVTSAKAGTRYAVAHDFRTTHEDKSAHYVVDAGGIVQVVFDSLVAEHCGKNLHKIGVELCDEQAGPISRWKDHDHQEVLRRGANLVAKLCLHNGLPTRHLTVDQLRADERGIVGHVDVTHAFPGVTTHTDPGIGFPWGAFLAQVHKHAAYLQAKARKAAHK